MTLQDYFWPLLGVGLLLAAWVAALRRQRDISDDSLRMAMQREWREGGSDVDVEKVRVMRDRA